MDINTAAMARWVGELALQAEKVGCSNPSRDRLSRKTGSDGSTAKHL